MSTVGSRIKYLRNELGLTQAAFALMLVTVTRGALGNWERDQGIKTENLRQIALKTGASLDWLATGRGDPPSKGELVEGLERFVHIQKNRAEYHDAVKRVAPSARGLQVMGDVHAGNWTDPDMPQDGAVAQFFVPADARYPWAHQYALVVRGKSIEKVAREGQALICVRVGDESPVEPRHGDIVIAERVRAQGGLIERTAKLLRIQSGRRELLPQYLDDKLNKPLTLKGDRDNEDIEVRIAAVVIGVYSPLRT